VWFKPCIFAYVVAAWLFLVIANLLMIPATNSFNTSRLRERLPTLTYLGE